MQQDELAALFQQSLNFQTPAVQEQVPEVQQEQGQNIEIEQQQQQQYRPAPIIYASTHYTPNTSHLLSRPASAPNLNSPAATNIEPATTSPSVLVPPSSRTNPQLMAIFARHDIDMADLSPGQLELFTGADADQQLRLLELWRITLRGAAAEDGVWTSATSLEMEERLARERYERLQQHSSSQQQPATRPIRLDTEMEMMTDDEGTASASASPTSTLASPRMMGINHLAGAEPYMLSGYEQLAKRDYEMQQQQQQQQHGPRRQGMVYGYSGATDPVYKAAVENQYGAFQAMREYGYESTSGPAGGWHDDEMVM
ncbi:hypothetical protein DBV05_g9776 [Lasiodiplodia theobromae]|uniref:Uncharacterized protein n=1 Tax=Lasiodiplodia theobromae TaxID=45133 RepID=A0A5N5D1R1_9PEZI|nr:hypothetical protein DBV05_g9776 [Lasiodiplodia theobromae]